VIGCAKHRTAQNHWAVRRATQSSKPQARIRSLAAAHRGRYAHIRDCYGGSEKEE